MVRAPSCSHAGAEQQYRNSSLKVCTFRPGLPLMPSDPRDHPHWLCSRAFLQEMRTFCASFWEWCLTSGRAAVKVAERRRQRHQAMRSENATTADHEAPDENILSTRDTNTGFSSSSGREMQTFSLQEEPPGGQVRQLDSLREEQEHFIGLETGSVSSIYVLVKSARGVKIQ